MTKSNDIIIELNVEREMEWLSLLTKALIHKSLKVTRELEKKNIYIDNRIVLDVMSRLEMDSIQNKIREKLKRKY